MKTTEPTTGFAWHVHHDSLWEWCTDYDDRVEYIRKHKPAKEQALHLRLFRMIPADRIPLVLRKARAALEQADDAYDKADAAYEQASFAYYVAEVTFDRKWAAYYKAKDACDKAGPANAKARATNDKARDTSTKARTTYWKAGVAYERAKVALDQAEVAFDKAWATYKQVKADCDRDMEKLHKKLCPDCPWDGRTIFPKEHKK